MQDHEGPIAGIMKFGMLLCCALMLAFVIWFLVAGGRLAGLAANWTLFLPLAICAGAHFLMQRTMGTSCHGHRKPTGPRSEDSPSPGPKREEKP